jgi:hypothetical protein
MVMIELMMAADKHLQRFLLRRLQTQLERQAFHVD